MPSPKQARLKVRVHKSREREDKTCPRFSIDPSSAKLAKAVSCATIWSMVTKRLHTRVMGACCFYG